MEKELKLTDFYYELPQELIAQDPLALRKIFMTKEQFEEVFGEPF